MDRSMRIRFPALLLILLTLAAGCSGQKEAETVELRVPRGYQQTLEISSGGRILSFGPFVGYYFKPENPRDLTRLSLICFNEEQFYTNDLPENAMLFTGEAVFGTLPETGRPIATGDRINPVFFSEAPEPWTAARPEPQDEFLHFHSCYDASGPVLSGFWIRHVGEASFTYDMGGRVTEESPLYHRVTPGPDKDFARIIEFDQGTAENQ
ncbi:MAG: hypothetical protein K9L59_05055 [Desulfobacterales bacterium]|nr:hypothetical protein [Desulfobacterales bacterium]